MTNDLLFITSYLHLTCSAGYLDYLAILESFEGLRTTFIEDYLDYGVD